MGFRLRLPSRTKISRWTVYVLFAGLFISLPAGVITAPPIQAASFGTVYNAPEYFFGGGTNSAASDCSAGQVVVGITFNHNGMSVGKICAPLLADYTIAAHEIRQITFSVRMEWLRLEQSTLALVGCEQACSAKLRRSLMTQV
jgi:hypothetical protein